MRLVSYSVGALAIGSGLIFTRFSLISFLIFIFILAKYFISSRNRLTSLVWMYLIGSILIAMVYMVGWLINLQITPTTILVVLAGLSWLLTIHPRYQPMPANAKPDDTSWVSLGVALAVCIFVSLPLLRNFSAETSLRYAAKTGDDINHIAIIEANRKVGGYLYSESTKYSDIIKPNYINYPQGWHINGAFMESLNMKLIGRDSMAVRLSSYLFYKVLWLFVAVFLVCELLYSAARLMLPKQKKHRNIIVAISGLAVSTFFLVPLFGYGFQSYIANLAMLCAALAIVFEYINTTDQTRRNIYLVYLGILTVGSSYVWLLSGITIGVLALAILTMELARNKTYLENWSLGMFITLPILILMAGLQFYIQLRYGPSDGVSSINLGGAIPSISSIGVISLFAITLLFISRRRPKKSPWLLILVSLSATEYLLIALYQQLALGEQRYYATKLAYSVALISSIVFFILVWAKLVDLKLSKSIKGLTFVVLVSILPFVLGLNLRKSAYPLKDGTPIKQATADYLLTIPEKQHDIVVRTDNKEESFLSTKLVSSVWSYSRPERETLLDRMDWEITH